MRISDLLGDGEEGVDPPDDRRYDDAEAAPQDIARSQFAAWQAGAPAEESDPTVPFVVEPPASPRAIAPPVVPLVGTPPPGDDVPLPTVALGVPVDDLLPNHGSRRARRGR